MRFDDPLVAAAYARQLAKKTDSAIERFTRNFNYPAESRVKTQADIQALGIKTYFVQIHVQCTAKVRMRN